MRKEKASLIEQMSANALLNSFDYPQLISLIIEIEEQAKAMDFTIPLYKHFKEIVAKESPEDL
jgi:hypothetical protein